MLPACPPTHPTPPLAKMRLVMKLWPCVITSFLWQAAELAIKFLGQPRSTEVMRTVGPQLVSIGKFSVVRSGQSSGNRAVAPWASLTHLQGKPGCANVSLTLLPLFPRERSPPHHHDPAPLLSPGSRALPQPGPDQRSHRCLHGGGRVEQSQAGGEGA